MLLSNIWKLGRRLQSKQSKRRSPGIDRPVQVLEERTYLSASTLFFDGELSIVIEEGNDSVAVRTNPADSTQVQVLVNGVVDQSLPNLRASDVERLTIIGSDTENLIDLSGVTTAAFTFVSINGDPLQITVDADNGDDTIIASDGFDDTLDGGDGNDVITISSGLGNLTIFGDDGNDTITGGSGNDTIDAHDGDDVVDAGAGDDFVIGGNGADSVLGNVGNDVIHGGDGADRIDGGLGDDTLNGQSGFDTLIGNDGSDLMLGGAHDDSLRGGDGDDTIVGNGGRDFIDADSGNDSVSAGSGDDTVYGNSGDDTINGQSGNDSIIADSGNDLVQGGAGADTINGARGDDTVLGQGDNDSLCGGGGADSVRGGSGADVITSVCPFDRFISIDDVSIEPEGGLGTQTATFTVTLSSAFDHEVIVDYVTMDGTASSVVQTETGLSDYEASSGRLVFLPGELIQTISISVNGDTLVESDENFFVILQNVERAEILDGFGEGRIVNDDLPPPPLLDLALALDATNSFEPVAPLLAAEFPGIVQRIQTALPGFDVGFGVSRFEDYGSGTPFVLNQPIIATSTPNFDAAITGALSAARNALGNGGVIPDFPESVVEALFQIATGDGFDGNGNGSRIDQGVAGLVSTQIAAVTMGNDVPPFSTFMTDPTGPVLAPTEMGTINDGIGFRNRDIVNNQESIRLILVGTDAGLKHLPDNVDPYVGVDGVTVPASNVLNGAVGNAPVGTAGVPFTSGASIQSTINELVQRNIRVIGIGGASGAQAQADPTDPLGAIRQPLESLSILTGGVNESGLVIAGTIPNDPIQPDEPLYFTVDPTDTNAGQVLADSLVQAVLGSVGPALVSAESEVVLEGENGLRQVSLTVRLSRPPSVDATVQYEFVDGSAENGRDFVASGGVLTFSAPTAVSSGDFVQTITIDIVDDDLVEGDEQFSLRLFNASTGLAFSVTDPNVTDLLSAITIVDVDVPRDAGDTLWGSDGDDTITGGEGDDFINGMSGDDLIDGGEGDDTLYGGAGRDTLQGNIGNDSLLGQGGADVLEGGAGDDIIVWRGEQDGDDSFAFEDGFDTIQINGDSSDNNFAIGQSGSTLIISEGTGSLSISGDALGFASGSEVVEVNGGRGNDTITINDINNVGFFVLRVNGDAGTDTITGAGALIGNVPVIIDGGLGDDTLTGTTGRDSILGSEGVDTIDAREGADTVSGGDGDDIIAGGDGNDTLRGDAGNDSVVGGLGNDLLEGGFGNDTLFGSDGNDTAIGSFGDDILNGMAGDDSLMGMLGRDSILGGNGDDTLDGGRDDDLMVGQGGNDVLRGDHGDDTIRGDSGDDTIDAGDGADQVFGGNGDDGIFGGDGDDTLNGESGADIIDGHDGDDFINAGGGDDVVVGGDGNDTINGNSGTDTVGGNLGDDVFGSSEVINDMLMLTADQRAKLNTQT